MIIGALLKQAPWLILAHQECCPQHSHTYSHSLPSAFRRISVPTVIVSSARDRLLPSIQEGARLLRLIPGSVSQGGEPHPHVHVPLHPCQG